MAARSGFALGSGAGTGSGGASMLGISPPRTTTAVSGDVAAFTSVLDGVGEVGEESEMLF